MGKGRRRNQLGAMLRKIRPRNLHPEVNPGPARGNEGVSIDPKHIGSSFDDWLKEEGFHDLLKQKLKGKAADRCLSVSAAAKVIGIPRSHLVDLIERAQIECHRDGRSLRIMASECRRYKELLQFKSKGGIMALMGSLPAVDSGRRGHVLRDDIYRDHEWGDR